MKLSEVQKIVNSFGIPTSQSTVSRLLGAGLIDKPTLSEESKKYYEYSRLTPYQIVATYYMRRLTPASNEEIADARRIFSKIMSSTKISTVKEFYLAQSASYEDDFTIVDAIEDFPAERYASAYFFFFSLAQNTLEGTISENWSRAKDILLHGEKPLLLAVRTFRIPVGAYSPNLIEETLDSQSDQTRSLAKQAQLLKSLSPNDWSTWVELFTLSPKSSWLVERVYYSLPSGKYSVFDVTQLLMYMAARVLFSPPSP